MASDRRQQNPAYRLIRHFLNVFAMLSWLGVLPNQAPGSGGEVTFYRQAIDGEKAVGKPQIALKLPFTFPLSYNGNAFDFSSDLSTIVYARPGGEADFYLLSQK